MDPKVCLNYKCPNMKWISPIHMPIILCTNPHGGWQPIQEFVKPYLGLHSMPYVDSYKGPQQSFEGPWEMFGGVSQNQVDCTASQLE